MHNTVSRYLVQHHQIRTAVRRALVWQSRWNRKKPNCFAASSYFSFFFSPKSLYFGLASAYCDSQSAINLEAFPREQVARLYFLLQYNRTDSSDDDDIENGDFPSTASKVAVLYSGSVPHHPSQVRAGFLLRLLSYSAERCGIPVGHASLL